MIKICHMSDYISFGELKLSVASNANKVNPKEFHDLKLFSPFCYNPKGFKVVGLENLENHVGSEIRSYTVENAWQYLKVWESENNIWDMNRAFNGFEENLAKRYIFDKNTKATGHYFNGQIIGLVEARCRIYCNLYWQLLDLPNRQELLNRLRSVKEDFYICDFDTYKLEKLGINNVFEAITYTKKPFGHGYLVYIDLLNKREEFKNYIRSNWNYIKSLQIKES